VSRATALAYDYPTLAAPSTASRGDRQNGRASGPYRLLGESEYQDWDLFETEPHLLQYPNSVATQFGTPSLEADAFISYRAATEAPQRRWLARRIARLSTLITPRLLLLMIGSLAFFLVATPTLGAALSRGKDDLTLSGYVDRMASAGAKVGSAQDAHKSQAPDATVNSEAAQPGGPAAAPQPQAPQSPPQAQAQAATVPGKYEVTGAPSLSVGQIEKVLSQYGSPAAGHGQTLYDLGVKYGVDPAYALAFFVHESGCGTKGVARFTKSLGNIRWTSGFDNYEGYRSYRSWAEGMEDWYKLITDLYIGGWGLRTVDAIIPVYAPWGDNNHPPTYIASVKAMVDGWRGK